jgi:hypothetical protein
MRGLRVAAVVVAVLLLLVVAAQLLATPVARWYTRRELDQLQGYEATVYDVRASLIPLRYHLQGLSIVEKPVQGRQEPLLFVPNVDVQVVWRKLLRGDLVADVSLDRPKIDLKQERGTREPRRLPNLGESLEKMARVRVDVVRIRDGAADFVDPTRSPPPEIWLHGVDGEVRDIATREALSRGRPTTLDATATLQHTGKVMAHVEADPWAKGLTFNGRVELRHLAAPDIDALLVSDTDLKPTQGSIDLYADFQARDGKLNGGVKVLAENLELAPGRKDLWTQVKTWLADAAIDVLGKKDQDPEAPQAKEVATIVPIKGTVDDPNAQPWPTILGVVRNAFVAGLERGFKNVPPNTSAQKESPLDQAAEALKKKKGPPKAQPQARTPRR